MTGSADFPTTIGLLAPPPENAFVTKLTLTAAAPRVLHATSGAAAATQGTAIAVDAGDHAYVVGRTNSNNFPNLHAFQPSFAGGSYDAFLTKLDAGGAIVYSSYLGGADADHAVGVAVDAAGTAYVTGYTVSENFPTGGGFVYPVGPRLRHIRTTVRVPTTGFFDAFVTKVAFDG